MAAFSEGQVLRLPDFARSRGLESDVFYVKAVFEGGMGACAKIESQASRDQYALKTVKGTLVDSRDVWERFVAEAKVWLTLSACDGVVEAYHITRINDLPCVCARWMEGGSLRHLLRRRDPALFFASMYRLVRILDWTHARLGVVHRDLKPENILLDQEERVYISDWGLARPLARARDTGVTAPSAHSGRPDKVGLTEAGRFIGTIFYASPEQILGVNIDHRSDIYSLGCIMYEWEAGHPPFVAKTAEEVAYGHLRRPVPRLGGVLGRTAFRAEEVITKPKPG